MNNDQRGSNMFVKDFQRRSKTTKAILPECSHQHLLLGPVPVASLQAEILIILMMVIFRMMKMMKRVMMMMKPASNHQNRLDSSQTPIIVVL